ncbi:MAG TPA: hypothetical protein PKD58_04545, partial [Candidatus Sumerlaeota bacterium]|nr:hypothetical protein [Candidatus Sumerlaeota bacterium]
MKAKGRLDSAGFLYLDMADWILRVCDSANSLWQVDRLRIGHQLLETLRSTNFLEKTSPMMSRTQLFSRKKSLIAAALMLAGITGTASAATFTSVATGDWDQAATWTVVGVDGDGIPDADDDVTIAGTFTVTIVATAACNSLSIAPVNALNLGNQTLTVENDLTNNGTLSSGGGGTLV